MKPTKHQREILSRVARSRGRLRFVRGGNGDHRIDAPFLPNTSLKRHTLDTLVSNGWVEPIALASWFPPFNAGDTHYTVSAAGKAAMTVATYSRAASGGVMRRGSK